MTFYFPYYTSLLTCFLTYPFSSRKRRPNLALVFLCLFCACFSIVVLNLNVIDQSIPTVFNIRAWSKETRLALGSRLLQLMISRAWKIDPSVSGQQFSRFLAGYYYTHVWTPVTSLFASNCLQRLYVISWSSVQSWCCVVALQWPSLASSPDISDFPSK